MSPNPDRHPFRQRCDLRPANAPTPLGFSIHAEPGHPYLRKRGLTPETQALFGLGLSRVSNCLKHRLIVPFHDAEGNLTGYAGRWPADPVPKDKSEWCFVGEVSQHWFNLHRARPLPGFETLIVADPFDLFHLYQHGRRKVLCLMNREISTGQLLALLAYFPQEFFVVLADETDSGRSWRERMAAKLAPFAFVRAPEFIQDGRTVTSLTENEIEVAL